MCRSLCFKQKTAYEMRISDWSSDVCSSDLYPSRFPLRAESVKDNGARTEGVEALNMRRVARELGVSARLLYHHVRNKDEMVELLADEIGRASCRERVCQYV